MQKIEIYTDGACRGNPGPGGWGAVIVSEGEETCLSGAEADTTNNRMELTAAIMALRHVNISAHVALTTDSEYVRRGITEWMMNWKRRGWRTAANKPVKNEDLWRALDQEASRLKVDWFWVKGHSGHPQNEKADKLATTAIDNCL